MSNENAETVPAVNLDTPFEGAQWNLALDQVPCNSVVSVFQQNLKENAAGDCSSQPLKLAVCPAIQIATKRVTRCPLAERRRPQTDDISTRSQSKRRTKDECDSVQRSGSTNDNKCVSYTARTGASYSSLPSSVWIQWRQVFRDKGLVRAAQAISDQLCKYCDEQNRYDRRLNRADVCADMPSGIDDCYDATALDAFNAQMKPALQEQFARWPRVYENMPIISVVKRTTASESDDNAGTDEKSCRNQKFDCDCL